LTVVTLQVDFVGYGYQIHFQNYRNQNPKHSLKLQSNRRLNQCEYSLNIQSMGVLH